MIFLLLQLLLISNDLFMGFFTEKNNAYTHPYYRINHDDNDSEDFNHSQVMQLLHRIPAVTLKLCMGPSSEQN
jgi:hypothetical protein